MADSGLDEQRSSSPRGEPDKPRSNKARRGYWVGGLPRDNRGTPGGVKRKEVPTSTEATSTSLPEAKTRRVQSPMAMEVGTPTRARTLSLSSSSDEVTAAASPDPLPIGLHTDMVHLIFPLRDTRVPPALRTGFRPIHPYPFTGQVAAANIEDVRALLELAWVEESARQRHPTVGSVSIMMQLRALWRWEQGWRRSRTTGEWIFMGESASAGFEERLQSETEDRSMLRGVALQRLGRMLREEDENCPMENGEAERRMRARLREIRIRPGPGMRGIIQFAANHVHQGEGNARAIQDIVLRGQAEGGPGVSGAAGIERPQPQPQYRHQDRQAQPQQAPQPLQGAGDGGAQRPQLLQGAVGQAAPFPEWPWSRGGRRSGRGRGRGKKTRTRSRLMPQDPWLQLLAIMANHPAIFEWLHRVRTTQHLLMAAHPNREHIQRVVESEERRARDLARSLLQGQEMTGAATLLDISWPPTNGSTVVLGRPGLFMPGADLTDETDDEDDDFQLPPPPHCGPWRGGRGRGRGGRGGRRGGRSLIR